ncbi:MAG: dihydrofolate reductase [Treponema sp.]|jgi:dihydrofolate reductase|nr:dihydrofolate reductase [Treponema sp.]
MELNIVAAMAKNRVIGKNNKLPWPLKEGLGNFKELTMGWPCIMGRMTWESLPKKPLPGRLNVVISSSVPNNESKDVKYFNSISAAIEDCAGYEKVFIIGGESIYKQALSLADKIELTLLRKEYDGDTFFPEIDTACWKISKTINFDNYSLITYIRS